MPKQSAAASAESIPESTHATRALDQSEQEYNRMISQQMTYHKTLMDDIIKLSSESGSEMNKINIVTGMGTTINNLNATNARLMTSVSNYADQGKQSATTASKLRAYTKKTASELNDDIHAYNALVNQNQNQEGFANANNPTLDAAVEISEIMNESQKYALVIFGLFAMFLLYKTIKHL